MKYTPIIDLNYLEKNGAIERPSPLLTLIVFLNHIGKKINQKLTKSLF